MTRPFRKVAVPLGVRIVIVILLCLQAGGRAPGLVWAAGQQPPSVLILNSYHQGYEWSDNEIEGVLEGLRSAYPEIQPAIEHLDLKRFPAESHQARLMNFLTGKYQRHKFDLAIVLDNPAFDILLRHRDEILPGIPVVFGGVNDFSPEMVSGRSGITGISEVQDHAGTLALALRLHPGTRRVLAVHDYTASGLAVRREMEAALPAFRGRIRVDFNDPARYDEVARQIAELRPGDLALILSFATDRAGRSLPPEQSTRELTAGARVPVYATHETRLGHGIVGGMLVGGTEHGRRAAALALRVLAGENPESIPVETDSGASPMFDHAQLQRFGVPPDVLPPGSILVNRPLSFYELHQAILGWAAGIIAVLLALIGCLLVSMSRRKRAERAQRESEERYRQVVEIIPDSIAIFVDERFAFVNASTMELLGAETPDRLIGRPIWDFCHPAYRSLGKNRFKQCQEEEAALPLAEFELIRLDGQARTIESAAVPIVYKNQIAVLSVWRDITLRRQMEHALRESEARFRLLYEKAPLPYQSLDRNGDFIEVNDAFLQALGYTRAEVIGRNFGEFLAPEWRDHFKQNFPRFKAVGEILGIEFEMVKKDGSRALVSFNGKIAFDRNGRFQQTHCIFTDITERRRTEAALAETTARLKEAQKIARIGQWELDLIANKLDWSDSIYELFEIPPNEFGASFEAFLDAVHPADRDRVRQAYLRSLADQTPYRIEHRLLMPDGRIKWVVEACRTDYGEKGEPLRSIGIVQDITERKQAEIDLQAQRDMLEAIFESSPFIMMLVDPEVRVRRINRVGEAFAGRPKEQAIDLLCGQVVRCINSFDGPGCGRNVGCGECLVRSQVAHTLKTGETILDAQGKFTVVRASGEWTMDMLVSTARVKVADQDYVLVSMFDITERVRAEEALRDSEERHRRIVESSSDAILLRSGETVVYANPAALRLFRANHPRELVGKRYLDLVHPDDRALSAERVKRNVDELWVASPREHRVMALDGQTVHVESTGVPVRYRGETQIFGVFRDITERRKADREREKLEAQLRQAQKMEAIGTLAGGIAHDFNNILSVIIGNSEILDLADAVNPSARDSLAQIMAAAQRAKQLVKQILAFSRHARQEKMVINLKPIVKETIDFLRASLPATIQVRHYLDPGAGQILADPTQMQQVLMNLCTNAGHAMEKEGGVLSVELGNVDLGEEDARLEADADPGRYVRLSVSDTGHGIEPVVLPRIFEPYFTTKEPGKGTGLGLSVVHGIVTSHDGMIKVYSEPGKGTVFRAYFPLADALASPEPAADRPLPRGSERILFVDDEPELADVSSRMLRSLGYEVETRTSPLEALEAFRANPGKFHLVVTDLTMPNLTGLKLAKKLTEISPGTPVVLCTGFSDQANEQRAQAIGVRGFLFKPLVMRDLAEAVRKALDGRPAGGSVSNPA